MPVPQQKITLAEMRAAAGVRGLLIYCSDYRCSHWTAISGDKWPDDSPVVRSSSPARLAAGAARMFGPIGNRRKRMPEARLETRRCRSVPESSRRAN